MTSSDAQEHSLQTTPQEHRTPAFSEQVARVVAQSAIRVTLFVLALVFFTYASVRVVHYQIKDTSRLGDGDWGVYYRAGRAMRLKLPLYTLEHGPLLTFKNPPTVALLIAPLSLLPIGLARWVWLVGDLFFLIVIYRLASRVIFIGDDPPVLRRLLIAGAVFLSLHYILDELFAGTTSLFYISMTIAAFVWACENKPIRAGAALGLAICLKVVPLAFVPWLLLSPRPVRSCSSLLATLVLLAFLPAVWVGPDRNWELLQHWPVHLAKTEIHEQEYRPTNQSLNAMLTRLLTRGVARMRRTNLASLSPRTVHALWLGMSALLGAAVYGWIVLQTSRGRRDDGAALSLLLLFMTLCNPLAWRYTYVAVGVPFLYVLHALARGIKPHRMILLLLALAYLLHFAPEFMQALSARFWGAVALAVAVIVAESYGTERARSELAPTAPIRAAL